MSNLDNFSNKTQLPPDTQLAQEARNLSTPLYEPNAAVRTAVDSHPFTGERRGEMVALLDQPASDLLSNLQDNAEELGAFLAGRIPLGKMTQRAERKQVGTKGSTPESDDTASATGDSDEQSDRVRRLIAFRDFSGGNGGGGGGQQQQRQYAQLALKTGDKIKKATEDLLKGFVRIRNEIGNMPVAARTGTINLTDDQQRDVGRKIWEVLQAYDSDAVQQLAALEVAATSFTGNGPADSAFLSVLLSIRDEFDEATVGRAMRETLSAVSRLAIAEATRESDPALFREQQRLLMRESRNFSAIFETLQKYDASRTLGEISSDFLSEAGSNLANSASPGLDDDFRHHLLTELAVLKKLNSVFDHAQQMVVGPMGNAMKRLSDMGLGDPEAFDAANVTRAVLAFVSNDNTDSNAVAAFETLLPPGAPTEVRILYSTCIANLLKELPDDLFPDGQINGDQTHRSAQDNVVKMWRADLAAQDEAEAA